MILRSIQSGDYEQIKRIHEKYYKDEFSMPNFVSNFIGAFVIEKNNQIVSVCSLRRIAEVIAITNKECSVRERLTALLTGSEAITFIAEREGYDQIHAFVQDESWEHILINKGKFKSTKGRSLVLDI